MNTVTLRPPAKINLTLDILGKRPDGYHDLDSVFLEVPIYDELKVSISRLPEDTLTVTGKYSSECPATKDNLVQKAVVLFRKELNPELPRLSIRLEKNIPTQAGLGGGSSDAASTLIACWRLSGSRPDYQKVIKLASKLGSDCPFFLIRGLARGKGRGEVLESSPLVRKPYIIIAVPDVVVPTPAAFAGLEESDKGNASDHEGLLNWLAGDESVSLENLKFHNSFQRSVSGKFPEVTQTIKLLKEAGATHSMLSGSGSACFGLYEQEPEKDILENFLSLAESHDSISFRLLKVPG